MATAGAHSILVADAVQGRVLSAHGVDHDETLPTGAPVVCALLRPTLALVVEETHVAVLPVEGTHVDVVLVEGGAWFASA